MKGAEAAEYERAAAEREDRNRDKKHRDGPYSRAQTEKTHRAMAETAAAMAEHRVELVQFRRATLERVDVDPGRGRDFGFEIYPFSFDPCLCPLVEDPAVKTDRSMQGHS